MDNLEEMRMPDIRKLCAELGIKFKSTNKKVELIEMIRAHNHLHTVPAPAPILPEVNEEPDVDDKVEQNVDVQMKLSLLFNSLKTGEAKAVVGKYLANLSSGATLEGLAKTLWAEIKDGSERAIVKQIMK